MRRTPCGYWCWRATASGRRSARRRLPCCARPTPSSACASPSRRRRSAGPRIQAAGTTFPHSASRNGQGRRRRAARAGVAQRLSAGAPRAASIRPVNCASGSTLYANIRPARSREGFPPRCGKAGRSRHRAREHRRLLRRPQHVSRLRRIHADAGSGDRHAQDHARRLDPHRARPPSSSRCSGARK